MNYKKMQLTTYVTPGFRAEIICVETDEGYKIVKHRGGLYGSIVSEEGMWELMTSIHKVGVRYKNGYSMYNFDFKYPIVPKRTLLQKIGDAFRELRRSIFSSKTRD